MQISSLTGTVQLWGLNSDFQGTPRSTSESSLSDDVISVGSSISLSVLTKTTEAQPLGWDKVGRRERATYFPWRGIAISHTQLLFSLPLGEKDGLDFPQHPRVSLGSFISYPQCPHSNSPLQTEMLLRVFQFEFKMNQGSQVITQESDHSWLSLNAMGIFFFSLLFCFCSFKQTLCLKLTSNSQKSSCFSLSSAGITGG